MMAENGEDVQLIGDEENLKKISSETSCKYNVMDVLDASIESLKNEFANEEIKGIAYCEFYRPVHYEW